MNNGRKALQNYFQRFKIDKTTGALIFMNFSKQLILLELKRMKKNVYEHSLLHIKINSNSMNMCSLKLYGLTTNSTTKIIKHSIRVKHGDNSQLRYLHEKSITRLNLIKHHS